VLGKKGAAQDQSECSASLRVPCEQRWRVTAERGKEEDCFGGSFGWSVLKLAESRTPWDWDRAEKEQRLTTLFSFNSFCSTPEHQTVSVTKRRGRKENLRKGRSERKGSERSVMGKKDLSVRHHREGPSAPPNQVEKNDHGRRRSRGGSTWKLLFGEA